MVRLKVRFFTFINREEVIVYRSTQKKTKIAKAAYLGPKDCGDPNGNRDNNLLLSETA